MPLTVLSRRVYIILLRILHNRIVTAAELHSHTLLLECFHPSAKLTEPPYFCTYHGTDGLSRYEDSTSILGDPKRLGELHNMYSRFRPYRRELESGGRRVLPRPGDVPGSRTFPGTVQDRHKGDTVKQTLGLEAHELFTQLVAQTNLVKIGPRNGLFTCFVGVEEGVLRVWRDWLKDMDAKGRTTRATLEVEIAEDMGKGKGALQEVPVADMDIEDPRILWVSSSKNTGIRFNVKERMLRRDAPIMMRADEESAVSYEIEYDGMLVFACAGFDLRADFDLELLIRTSYLLLMLEKSRVQEDNASGKAIVFGSFG